LSPLPTQKGAAAGRGRASSTNLDGKSGICRRERGAAALERELVVEIESPTVLSIRGMRCGMIFAGSDGVETRTPGWDVDRKDQRDEDVSG
jgi:hypothetical protein